MHGSQRDQNAAVAMRSDIEYRGDLQTGNLQLLGGDRILSPGLIEGNSR